MIALLAATLLSLDPWGFLREELGFGEADFARLRAGEPVGKLLPARAPGELALGGAIRLRVDRDAWLAWYHDPRNWTLGLEQNRPAILDARFLSHPPALADFAALVLEPADRVAALRCRPGDCAIKAGDALAAAFADPDRSPDDDLRAAWLQLAHARAHPDSLLFWTRERYGFGLKITAALYSATLHHHPGGVTLVTTTLLAATHYFDSSTGLTLVADLPEGGAILAYVNRSQIDALRRGWGARFRAVIHWNVPRSVRRELRSLAARIEATAAPAAPARRTPLLPPGRP